MPIFSIHAISFAAMLSTRCRTKSFIQPMILYTHTKHMLAMILKAAWLLLGAICCSRNSRVERQKKDDE
jgi:hypothetical protein